MKKIVLELRHVFDKGITYTGDGHQHWQKYQLFNCEFAPDEKQLGRKKNRIKSKCTWCNGFEHDVEQCTHLEIEGKALLKEKHIVYGILYRTLIDISILTSVIATIGIIFFAMLYVDKKEQWALNALFLTVIGALLLILAITFIYYLYILIIAHQTKFLIKLPRLKQIQKSNFTTYNLFTEIKLTNSHTINEGTVVNESWNNYSGKKLYKIYKLEEYFIVESLVEVL
ncbi:MAG: hypothetical protein WAS55_10920 [Saprospiraceae bacterium]|nr:hypothetical protein [Saprospiraceae bacterium]MBK9728280.1 hypothetical protein [Saprospiraceae bacterium]